MEGNKTATYTGVDKLTRNISATVRQDSVIYCVVRTNADGSMNKLIKYRMFIGDILVDTRSIERAIAYFNEGERKINKLTFYAVEGKQLNTYQEMICSSKQYGLYKKEVLEMSFDNEVDARAFLANVQAIHTTLPPKTANSSAGNDKKADDKGKTYNYISVFNDMGSDMYIKKEGDPAAHHIAPNASSSFTCKLGEKFSWCEKNSSNPKGYLFSVTDQMIKDKTIKLSSGTKK
ncbi:MAG: hypothetical protein V4677_02825 [Bacteroidota bacterium]